MKLPIHSQLKVWEWISNFIPQLIMDINTYSCWHQFGEFESHSKQKDFDYVLIYRSWYGLLTLVHYICNLASSRFHPRPHKILHYQPLLKLSNTMDSHFLVFLLHSTFLQDCIIFREFKGMDCSHALTTYIQISLCYIYYMASTFPQNSC